MPVRGSFYQYAAEYPVTQYGWHGRWRQAPNDGYIGPADPIMVQGPVMGPAMADGYGPPPGYYDGGYGPEPVDLDRGGWSGGVGYGADGGGGGGGFTDGYGQVHFSDGGSAQNGPTYNDYGQSFQFNPSTGVAGPFQARLMGGFAPATSSSK